MHKKVQTAHDPRIAEEMKKNGVPCHSKALFLALSALAANESKSEVFSTKMNIRSSPADKIAAKLVYDFLRREEMRITLQVVQNEGDLHYFSRINKESTEALNFRANKPPIQKLIRMRFSKAPKIGEDDDITTGWFDIDSEMDRTMTIDDQTGTTYNVDESAWQNITTQDSEKRPAVSPRSIFSLRRMRELSVAGNVHRKRRDYSVKSDVPIRPPIKLHVDDDEPQPVQLIKSGSGASVASMGNSSIKFVPSTRSSSSGRRGRRTEEEE